MEDEGPGEPHPRTSKLDPVALRALIHDPPLIDGANQIDAAEGVNLGLVAFRAIHDDLVVVGQQSSAPLLARVLAKLKLHSIRPQ